MLGNTWSIQGSGNFSNRVDVEKGILTVASGSLATITGVVDAKASLVVNSGATFHTGLTHVRSGGILAVNGNTTGVTIVDGHL